MKLPEAFVAAVVCTLPSGNLKPPLVDWIRPPTASLLPEGVVPMPSVPVTATSPRKFPASPVLLSPVTPLPLADLHYSYRHSELPYGAIVVAARLRGRAGDPVAIQAEMDRIAAAREESQPLRSKTGGSTFKNPEGHKAWELVDRAGCRGLTLGGAQVSEKHTNFLINTGAATSAEIEALGEEVRRQVKAKTHITLEWEIQRVGKE